MPSPKTLSALAQYTYDLLQGEKLAPRKSGVLYKYLKDSPAPLADYFPGEVPRGRSVLPIATPNNNETWYRGGDRSLKLQSPIFMTRDPNGAAYFAAENGGDHLGAVGEYKVDVRSPARFRDMLRMQLEEPSVLKAEDFNHNNIWDWMYNPEFRGVMQDKGYDSALGLDSLGRGEIPALIALSPEQVTPVARSMIEAGRGVSDSVLAKYGAPFKDSRYYTQIGATKPFKRKAGGGSVNAKS